MDQPKTAFNLTEEDNGEWTLVGVWVIDNFPTVAHKAQSPEFPIRGDMKMYIRFVDPLTRMKTRTTITIFFTSVPGDYPMDLSVRLLNAKEATHAKTTHVVYSASALRSYIDFNVLWADLTEEAGYVEPGTGALRIEFRFHHRLEPYQIPPEVITRIVPVLPNQCKPPAENFRESVGVIGIHNTAGDDCLNSVILALSKLPRFEAMVFQIQTRGIEESESPIYALQRLLCDLELNDTAPDSKALAKKLAWASDHFASSVCREALSALLGHVQMALTGKDLQAFEDMVLCKTYRIIRCPGIGYEKKQEVVTYDIEVEATGMNDTFEQLMDNFSTKIVPLQPGYKYHVEGKGLHEAFIGTEFTKIPDVLFITLQRFNANPTGGYLMKNSVDLKIPKEFNFNRMMKSTGHGIPDEIWDLRAVIVHSGRPDSGMFYVNIRDFSDPSIWLEFRSYQVCRVTEERAINGNDAVMVMYTKRSMHQFLYEPFDLSLIPEHVKSPVQRQPPFNVTLMTTKDMKNATLRGEIGCGTSSSWVVPVHLDDTFEIFRDVIASIQKTTATNLRLWTVSRDGVVGSCLPLGVRCQMILQDPFVFVEEVPEGAKDLTNEDKLIFMKFFWKEAPCPLQFIGSVIVKGNQQISSVFDNVRSIMGVEASTPLLAFLEHSDYSASILNAAMTFEQAEIPTATTIIFQCPPGYTDFSPTFKFEDKMQSETQHQPDPCPVPENLPEVSLVYDVTSDDFPGDIFYTLADTVDVYYDVQYHMVYIAVQLTSDANEPPQFYFKIPMSLSFVKLETLIKEMMSLSGNLAFFMPNDEGTGPCESPVDRATAMSLHDDIVRYRAKNPDVPVVVYIEVTE